VSRVLVDVTHTFGHPHNTGVQRVVRRLAVWARHWPNTTFIRFDRSVHDFVPLSEDDVGGLIDGWTTAPPTKEPNQGFWRRLARWFPGSQAAMDALRTYRTQRSIRLTPRRVDFRGAVYFSAEVFGEADRTTALNWWFAQGQTEVALVVHDLIPYFHPEWSIFNRKHFANYLNVVGRASLVAPVSQHTQDQVARWFTDQGRPLPRLKVVRPGFDLPGSSECAPGRTEGLGRVLACVGTLEARKNQIRVLWALKRLWDEGKTFSFVFAGKEADGGEFRRVWEPMATAGYPVHWWNPASEAEVEWLYGHAVATVYPSLAEGFGLPVVESLARGTPCITASVGATAETAADLGGCLTVDPTDTGAIQAAIGRMLDEPSLRDSLVAGFRRDRMRRWEDYARDIQAVVGELAD